MQVIPITIEKKLFPVKKIIEFHGETIAYEVETFSKDFENSEQGGFFDLSNWGVIEIAGPDSLDYLQRMSTANMKPLTVGFNASGAFLTGKGTLISIGTFLCVEANRFLFIVSPNQTENALTHLEMFHFQEKIEIKDRTSELALIGLWRSKENLLKQSWQSSREKNLSYALLPRDEYGKVILELHKQGLAFLGMRLFHYFRIQAGLPWMGWEVGPADLVLEAGLDDFVARNKGCYPGQEVVERIFTYGQVNRKLMRVKIEGQGLESVPQEQEIKQDDGTVVGTLKSLMANPKLEDPGFGLAYVRKAFWESTAEFRTDIGLKIKWDPVPGEVPNG
jgi:folate-binding protein YgfZ